MRNNKVLPLVIAIVLVLILFVYYFIRGGSKSDATFAQADENPSATVQFVADHIDEIMCVYFVPGYLTELSPQNEQIEHLKKIYPTKDIRVKYWKSLRSWATARNNADKLGKLFAEELVRKHGNDDIPLDRVVLIGHSLGGRIVARTLAELGRMGKPVHHAVVLGAAINNNDDSLKLIGGVKHDTGECVGGTVGPVISISNESDLVLGQTYFTIEKSKALGQTGPKISTQVPGVKNCPATFQRQVNSPGVREMAESSGSFDILFESKSEEETDRICEFLEAEIQNAKKAESPELEKIPDQIDGETVKPMKPSPVASGNLRVAESDQSAFDTGSDDPAKVLAEGLGLDMSQYDFSEKRMLLQSSPDVKNREYAVSGFGDATQAVVAAIIGLVNVSSHDSIKYIDCYSGVLNRIGH